MLTCRVSEFESRVLKIIGRTSLLMSSSVSLSEMTSRFSNRHTVAFTTNTACYTMSRLK